MRSSSPSNSQTEYSAAYLGGSAACLRSANGRRRAAIGPLVYGRGGTQALAWSGKRRSTPMKKFFAPSAVTIPAMLWASQPLEDALQPSAVKVAQQRGASELGCPAATAEVLSKHAIE